jgi:DNA replication protein DnaC
MDCANAAEYCPKIFKIDYLYNEALLSPKQRTYTPLRVDEDGTDRDQFIRLKKIEDNIDAFVSDGCNLYLHSQNCGNGKTEWAIRLMQAYVGKVWHKSDLTCKVLFVHVPRYLNELKNSFNAQNEYVEHIKSRILKADLVVFDEIATKAGTQFELEILLSLINTRIDMNKSNIYTSNVSGQDLRDKIGDRLYSRVVNMSTDIELFGKDKRCLSV